MLNIERRDAWGVWTWLATGAVLAGIALATAGVPAIDLHGPLHRLGIMDPLCGGTRAWYLTMDGRLREAFHYNPVAPLLLLAAVAMVVRAAAGHITGHWITLRVSRPIWRRILLPALTIVIVALQINQQLHAPLLLEAWDG